MANGLHGKNLAQSETLCTWRNSLRGTWEVSSMPGLGGEEKSSSLPRPFGGSLAQPFVGVTDRVAGNQRGQQPQSRLVLVLYPT
jgi:hypothetical protein